MHSRNAILLSAGAVIVACGGKTITDSEPSSTTLPPHQEQAGADVPATTSSPTSTVRVPPPPSSCVEQGSSASGGPNNSSGNSCSTEASFQCSTGEMTLACQCSSDGTGWRPGSCTCNDGVPFPFDCSRGCLPGAGEYAKCNLPAPDYGASGSMTSSSG